jgi:hypothetical protein
MRSICTRAAVVLASSAFVASGVTMTVAAATAASPAATTLASPSPASINPCPNTTLIEYCAQH